jgi:glycosyltransferase involved in cell wall biosynthesis
LSKVSVVIPTYNNLESFKRAFNSVLMQIYEDYEIIISDDSNNNDIKNFLENAPLAKIKYFKNPKALGSPENWNNGIRMASGEYIKILHHDDWFSKRDALEKFVNIMDENPKCDLGYSKSVNVDTTTGKKRHRKAEKYVKLLEESPYELLKRNRIGAPSVAIFRSSLNIEFDKNLKWLVDVDFYLRILLKNRKIAFINEELINIGIQENRVTDFCAQNNDLQEYEHKYVADKFKEILHV